MVDVGVNWLGLTSNVKWLVVDVKRLGGRCNDVVGICIQYLGLL